MVLFKFIKMIRLLREQENKSTEKIFLALSAKRHYIHQHLLLLTANDIKPLNILNSVLVIVHSPFHSGAYLNFVWLIDISTSIHFLSLACIQ